MRQLGTISSEQQARFFHDYLQSQGISSQVEQADSEWEIWAIDEDHLDDARESWDRFHENPTDPAIVKSVEDYREKHFAQQQEAIAQMRERMQQRSTSQSWNNLVPIPVTWLLIILSVGISLAMHLDTNEYGTKTEFTIAKFRPAGSDMIRWRPGLQEVQEGQVWRLLTPVFLHFDAMHLLFNMYWLYLFGAMIEPAVKSWRFALMVILIGVLSNLGEYYVQVPQFVLKEDPSFGGMSGVNFGLFGYIIVRSRAWGVSEYDIPDMTMYLMLAFFLICMTGALGPIANGAHAFGLLVGALIGELVGRYQKLIKKPAA